MSEDYSPEDYARLDHEITRSLELIENLRKDYDTPEEAISMQYALWVALTRHLAMVGWKPDELAKDAKHHAAAEAEFWAKRRATSH